MADKFTCKLCKRVVHKDDGSGTDKGKCPTHGDLCSRCSVDRGIFNRYWECRKCGKKMTVYAYHWDYGKWMKKEGFN